MSEEPAEDPSRTAAEDSGATEEAGSPAPAGDPEARTLEVLEWASILRELADRCRSAPARRAALEWDSLREPEPTRRRLAETDQALRLLLEGAGHPVGTARDLRSVLDRLPREVSLEPEELLDAAAVLEQIRDAAAWTEEHGEQAPALAVYGERLEDFPSLRSEIRRCIETGGEVADAASPRLAEVRRRVQRMAGEVRRRIQEIVSNPDLEDVLQERFFTVREGRFVVPVRREARSGLRGIVHGRSSSGASFFIEPESVVEANNEHRVAQEEEREEVLRILTELTERVRSVSESLARSYEALVALDLIWARAELARDMDAVVPELVETSGDGGLLDLVQARHPMLALREPRTVVPNDLSLEETRAFLVVTGPNTGGKTVAMKTAGLAVLMARAGLAVPAAPGARLTPFARVLADLGDEQSLELHLSSFSGHLTRIQEIRRHAGPGALVLLDEVVSGTDPREGAALARALLEDLARAGSQGIVTTHYPELKGLASEDERFRNAGMEFDPETLQPTFRMIYDLPGRSSALAVARRLGLDEAIVERAEKLHGEEAVRLDALLQEVEELRTRVEEEQAAAARARRKAEKLAQDRDQEIRRLRQKDREYLGEAEKELAESLERAREEASRIARRIQEETEQAKVEEARRRLKEIKETAKERLQDFKEGAEEDEGAGPDPSRLTEGRKVWLRQWGKKAVVSGPATEDGVPVTVGAVRMTVPLNGVKLLGKGGSGRRRERDAARRREVPAPSSPEDIPFTAQTDRNALDLRGQSVQETLTKVDRFLDDCMKNRISPVVLIHGHGTGKLRRALRQHLEGSPYIAAFRPGERGEGEDGVTVAALAG